jgi:hypothetical protein
MEEEEEEEELLLFNFPSLESSSSLLFLSQLK